MKNFFKNIVKIKIIAIISVIVIISFFLISGFAYILDLLDATNPNHTSAGGSVGNVSSRYYDNNMPAQIENRITSKITSSNIVSKGNGDYKLDIDLDAEINSLFEDMKKTTEGKRVLDFMSGTEQEKKELLKNMVRAEILTQYPDLRSKNKIGTGTDSNEVQGVIKIKRVLSDEIKKVRSIEKSTITTVDLNGIVCWGDNYTLGNPYDSNDSYPAKLAELTQSNAYNLGFENETAEEILLRAGADGYVFNTTGEFSIGANAGAEATFSAEMKIRERTVGTIFKYCDGSEDSKKLKCTISGIEGELIYTQGQYKFKRTSEGSEQTTSAGTEIKIETQGGYNECIPIIWIGNNNYKFTTNDGELNRLVNYYKDLIKMLDNPEDYIVIIPMYYKDYNGEQKQYESDEYAKIVNKLKEAFNNHCVDLKESGWSRDSGYDSLANILKEKIADLGYNIGGRSEQNPNAGQVTFSGTISVGEEITLEYIPLGNKLQPEPGTLRWLIQQEDDDLKNAALQFFSIDSTGNLIVANWSRVTTKTSKKTDGAEDEGYPTEEVEYRLSTVKVNYKNSVSQYTMPFDYLWTFLVTGEDVEFVQNIASLALNSKIEATLYDELTIIENDDVETHKDNYKTEAVEHITETNESDGTENSYENNIDPVITTIDKYTNINVVIETNKVKYRLTYADVWNQTYRVSGIQQIHYDGHGQTSNENDLYQQTITILSDEDWQLTGQATLGPTTQDIYKYYENESGIMVPEKIGTKTTTRYEKYYQRKTDQKTVTTIIKSGYTYTEGVSNTEEKTDKEVSTEEIETRYFSNPNFVKYYLYSKTARTTLSSVYSWLFEFLEANGRTAEMVDITKYMIYKATDNDLGVTSYDFSVYNETDFKDAIEYNPIGGSDDIDGALGKVELDGSYNVDGILLSNPIAAPIAFVGSYSNHGAVDINPTQNGGTPVYAAADGTVVTATYHSSYGNYVIINHGNGVSTLYAHAQSLVVSAGQTVSKGQLIMFEGTTGNSSGPHVHFEIRRNGVRSQALAEDMFRRLGFTIQF